MKPITRGRIARIEPDFDVDDVESRKGQNTLNGKPSAAFNDVDDPDADEPGTDWVPKSQARVYIAKDDDAGVDASTKAHASLDDF